MSNLFFIPFVQIDQQTLEMKQKILGQDPISMAIEKSSVERQSRYRDESKET